MSSGDDTCVRVAVRVRPQLAQERIAMCGMCTSVTPGEPQLVLGKDRAFTYDYVFDTFSDQESVYNSCVHSLVESCLNGYNATILAYGQTGSGKTYTMGTGFDVRVPAEEQGIIPRAVAHLFKAIDIRKKQAEDKNETPPEFKMAAQFMELYNEEIYDLFDVTREPGKRSNVKIHEDSKGGIYTVGVTSQDVRSQEETIKVLQRGALSRTTASTCMNAQSSRSHAIFSIIIEQQRVVRMSCESVDGIEQLPEVTEFDFETLRAKFHFVDLAGSERLKRTGATGDRAKEGISINCGLLALGNVISALGDVTRKASHVPYRDSKLTRLLQDSLGGNSKTLMIACVSPTDRDFMETLNTLKYANRTRNIKNKVVVNQDKASQVIMQLRQKIQQLQVELNEFKQGKLLAGKNGAVIMNDLHHENTMLKSESDKLRLRLKAAHETINTQSERLVELQAQVAVYKINGDDGQAAGEESQVESMIKGYLKEIEDLRGQLLQSESLAHHQPPSPFRRLSGDQPNMTAIRDTPSVMSPLSPSLRMFQWDTLKPDNLESILTEAKKDVEKDMVKLKEKENKLKGMGKQQDSMSEEANSSDDEFESAEGGESAEEDEDHSSGSEDIEQPAINTEGDIAELSNEISIKEKLVFQLEHSKRQLETMKDQYEQKMATLQERIRRTEAERDQVLDNLTNSEQAAEDVKQRVKDQYESRLLTLQKEMRQLKAAKKQHQALLRENAQNEQQLKVLKNDLQEMKKQKVQLMRKLREESTLSKQLDAKRNKEIAQLKKQQRRSEHVIKNLEADQKKRDIVLQRRNEEIAVLRRQRNVDQGRVSQSQQQPRQPQAHSVIRASTASAAMACGPERKVQIQEQKRDRKPSSLFSSVGSRRKWRRIDSMISEVIVQKQTIGTLEDDMDRWIQERQRLHHELEENKRKQEEARDSEVSDAFISDLMEQYESLSSNLDYADQNIQDRESDIMALMDAKGDGESAVLTGLIKNCSASEAKYILERCVNSNVDVGVQLGRERTEKHQLEEQIKALEQQLKKQEELLLQQTGRWASEIHSLPTAELESLMNKLSDESPSQPENSSPDSVSEDSSNSGSIPPVDAIEYSSPAENNQEVHQQLVHKSKKDKIRRRTATPNELLYSLQMDSFPSANSLPSLNEQEEETETNQSSENPPETKPVMTAWPEPLPQQFKQETASQDITSNDSTKIVHVRQDDSDSAKTVSQEKCEDNDSTKSDLARPASLDMAPSSLSRNVSASHVFQRLSVTSDVPSGPEGKIVTMKHGESRRDKCLTCTHLIQGHTSAVLTLDVNGSTLYTGSQDRTIRVWDLEREEEVVCLVGQPSSVTKVVYCPKTNALFTGSQSQIKVWDLRESEFKCVKTLGQSGSDKAWKGAASSDTVHDMVLDRTGSYLYSATSSSSSVKIWDLRKFSAVGKLSGHSAPVVCLLVNEDNSETDGWVFTGSRDHYVRGFDIYNGCPTIQQPPGFTFKPPHYDGVQSLAIVGKALFSGSRDYSIKQWDIERHSLKQAINAAHSHWVTAMMKLPRLNVLVSGCRSGVIKLWTAQNCQQLGETSAHKFPINAISTCNGHILTASSDRTVKVWKVKDDVIPLQ